jgi:hypothetical protein
MPFGRRFSIFHLLQALKNRQINFEIQQTFKTSSASQILFNLLVKFIF